MIRMSVSFIAHWYIYVGLLVILVLALVMFVRTNHRLIVRMVLGLPMLRQLGTNIDLTRFFTRSFGLLLRAGRTDHRSVGAVRTGCSEKIDRRSCPSDARRYFGRQAAGCIAQETTKRHSTNHVQITADRRKDRYTQPDTREPDRIF